MARSRGTLAWGVVVLACLVEPAVSSDHNDGNETFEGWDIGGRREANLTDFFAFRPPESPETLALVLALGAGLNDPDFTIPEDVTVRFHIDNHSQVAFTDGDPATERDDWMMRFGGTVLDVGAIRNDIVFEITFEPTPGGGTAPVLLIEGLPAEVASDVVMFPGPDGSPLRGGRPIVAIEVPLADVVTPDDLADPLGDTLLLWATIKVPEIRGHLADHLGMPNTSNQPGNLLVNTLRPRDHAGEIGDPPRDLYVEYTRDEVDLAPYADVLIYDLRRAPHGFPPGRGPLNRPPPPGFVQFDRSDSTSFPNGRPVTPTLAAPAFPYVAE